MVERLEELRKGRRESIEKGSRERIEKERKEKETKRQFEEKEGLRDPLIRPCDVAIVSSSPQGMRS